LRDVDSSVYSGTLPSPVDIGIKTDSQWKLDKYSTDQSV